MKLMRTGGFLFSVLLALACLAAEKSVTVRGKLVQDAGKPPAIETREGKRIALDGDTETRGVLNDKRLAGFDPEARGRYTAPDRFLVDPIHTRALFVYKDGKAKLITYWCDTCSIRTYTPGTCWCCQEETALDLQDR